MDKIWYIYIAAEREGPYTLEALLKDPRVTEETFVWRQGMAAWARIKDVPELKTLFAHAENPVSPEDSSDERGTPGIKSDQSQEELALDMRSFPPPYIYWIIFLAILILYFLTTLQS